MELAIKSLIQISRRPVVQKLIGSMFTQGLLSMTNFALGLTVAKYASKSEYGIYVILFSVMGIVGNYQNALINTPLAVLFYKKELKERDLFVSGLGVGQWLLFLPLIIVTLIIVIMYSFIYKEFTIIKYAFVLSAATFTYMIREFIRAVNYSKMRINLIIKMDLFFVLCVSLGIFILIALHRVTSSFSITILGVGYLFSAIFEYLSVRDVYVVNWPAIKNAFIEIWHLAKWSLISVSSYMLQNRGYIYIVSATLGLHELADISAARLFLMPLGLILQSSNQIIIAKGAQLLNSGSESVDRFKKFILLITAFLFSIWTVYIIFLWLFNSYLVTNFLGDKYSNLHGFIFLWAVSFLLESIRSPLNRALMACKEFKVLANYDVISAIVTTVACLVLTGYIRGYGAITALILGEFTLLLFNVVKFIKFFKQDN